MKYASKLPLFVLLAALGLASGCTTLFLEMEIQVENLPFGADVVPCLTVIDSQGKAFGDAVCDGDAEMEPIQGGFRTRQETSQADFEERFSEEIRYGEGNTLAPYLLVDGKLYAPVSFDFEEGEDGTLSTSRFVISPEHEADVGFELL